MKTSFTCLLVLLCSALFAQPGALDSGFGSNGKYVDNVQYYPAKPGRKLVRQLPDGRIIVACIGNYNSGTGKQDFSVFCLTANGSLDYSFGTSGRTSIPFETEHKSPQTTSVDYVTALAIQADGKIVIAGVVELGDVANNNYYDVGVARLNSNGTIDSTFDKDGRKEIDMRPYSSPGSTCYNADYCTGVVITGNGRILLSGYTINCSNSQTSYDAFVVQLNPNGSFVKQFANNGVQVFYAPATDEIISGSALQANGKLLLMGSKNPVNAGANSDILLERVNANGTLDNTFNGTGYTVSDIAGGSTDDASAGAVAVLPGGKIFVAAMANKTVYLIRYNANGKTDATFGLNGRVAIDSMKTLTSLSVAPDGKIILTTSDFSVYRYLPNGTRDNTFGTNGSTTLNVYLGTCTGSAVQQDGKILTVGTMVIYVPKSISPNADVVVRLQGAAQAATNRSAVVTKSSVNSNKLDVQVYANPSHDHFRIRVSTTNATDKINLKVVDLSGKVMEVISGVQAGVVKELGAAYPSGTYIIDVIQGNSDKAVRVMKL